jgi:ABC-type multidrug transport system fused ATPase/permease subunit
MNSVERMVYYATEIEQEAPYELPHKKPKDPWPSKGEIEMKDVVLNYRPELPPVLKGKRRRFRSLSLNILISGISMTVRAGEKIGIVGR